MNTDKLNNILMRLQAKDISKLEAIGEIQTLYNDALIERVKSGNNNVVINDLLESVSERLTKHASRIKNCKSYSINVQVSKWKSFGEGSEIPNKFKYADITINAFFTDTDGKMMVGEGINVRSQPNVGSVLAELDKALGFNVQVDEIVIEEGGKS